jgi:RNA polymerase sigma factor (sigma-70 family)
MTEILSGLGWFVGLMSMAKSVPSSNGKPSDVQKAMLYHFCRMQVPDVRLSAESFDRHLERSYELYKAKAAREQHEAVWQDFLDNLYAIDWFLACACLDGESRAWELLFAARASRTDCLLVDALRARAVRLFPRDPEKQDSVVTDFWGFLLTGEKSGSLPVLARYDGQRPLVPWLIRVFQNRHISELRQHKNVQPLPEAELEETDLPFPVAENGRWHEEFRTAARAWLGRINETESLILGLRLRYRISQRELSSILGIHEGNVSRHTTQLRDRCLDEIGKELVSQGWTGDDLSDFILKEMDSLLMDEPRLSADHLATILARRGKALPSALQGA